MDVKVIEKMLKKTGQSGRGVGGCEIYCENTKKKSGGVKSGVRPVVRVRGSEPKIEVIVKMQKS